MKFLLEYRLALLYIYLRNQTASYVGYLSIGKLYKITLEGNMKVTFSRILLLFAFSFFIGSFSFAVETVVMGVGEFAPLISKDLKHNGVISRVVEEAFKKVGVKVEYRWAPWKRVYSNVAAKSWDLAPAFSKNIDRMEEVIFSDPLFEKYIVFFHLKTFKFDWKKFEDLKDIKTGATRGYFYGDEYNEARDTGELKVEEVATDCQSLKMILSGRIQVFPLNILTGYFLIQNTLPPHEAKLFTHHPKKLAPPSPSFVIFPKSERGKKISKLFNKGLKMLKDEGKYRQYFQESNRCAMKK